MPPKILVCTVESWNSRSGANTFSTLLKDHPAEKMANLFLREEFPDNDACCRYFQISEQRIIKKIFNPRTKTGKEIAPCQSMNEQERQEVINRTNLYNKNRKKRSYAKLLIRELIWKLGGWKSKELICFLEDFQPDVVLFCLGGYIHFNRICRFVVRHTKSKAIGYFYDDNFHYTHLKESLGHTILRFFQRISLKKTVKKCHAFWAITEKTKTEADAFFNIDCTVLTKPIDFLPNEVWNPYELQKPIQMLYTGNLLIGRFDVICLLSDALSRINQDKPQILLDVYSGSYIPKEEVNRLCPFVKMHGAVTQEQVLELQENADVLLFAEAIHGPDSRIARLSFSTKLTDYLHSGKCILAIGAKDLAPMEYLAKENAALCASNEEEIYQQLISICENPSLILQTAQQAFICGKQNHSREHIQKKIAQTFRNIGVEF